MSLVKRAFFTNGANFQYRKECSNFNLKNFKRSLSNKIVPVRFPQRNLNPLNYLYENIRRIFHFYEEFSGLKEVKCAQEKVEESGEKLALIQEERRIAYATLLETQHTLRDIHSNLENTKKGDQRYLQLIMEEHKLLTQEEKQQEKFKTLEREEREHFTMFTHLIKASHEKERVQSQKAKYWFIIFSVVGTMAGYIASTVSSHAKRSELKKLIAESSNSNLQEELNKFLKEYKKVIPDNEDNVENKMLNDLLNGNTVNNNSQMHKYLNDILKKTSNILINLEETIKIMKSISEFEIYKLRFNNETGSDVLLMNLMSYRESVRYENEEMKKFFVKFFLTYVIGTIVLKVIF